MNLNVDVRYFTRCLEDAQRLLMKYLNTLNLSGANIVVVVLKDKNRHFVGDSFALKVE